MSRGLTIRLALSAMLAVAGVAALALWPEPVSELEAGCGGKPERAAVRVCALPWRVAFTFERDAGMVHTQTESH